MKVSEIMREVMIVDDHISIKDAINIMNQKSIGSLVAVKDGKIKGIITEKDILRSALKLELPISKIMTKKVITLDNESDLREAAEIMIKNRIERIPIIKEGVLVGIVKILDVLDKAYKEEDFLFN